MSALKHPTWLPYQDSKRWSRRHRQRSGWCESQKGVAFMSILLCGFWTWKGKTQIVQLRSGKCQQNSTRREIWSLFQQYKCADKVNIFFGFNVKKIEDGSFKHFSAHEKNTLLERWKLVCTENDLMKFKEIVNKTDVVESCSREMKKMDLLQVDKFNCVCCFTQRRTYWLQRRCFNLTSMKKW